MKTAASHTLVTTVYLLLLCCWVTYCQNEGACSGQFRADVIFALDSSGSVVPESFRKMESFSKRVIQSLPIHPDSGFRVGAMGFSDSAWTPIDLKTYSEKAPLLQGFHIEYNEGGSNTTAALEAFRTMFTEERGDRSNQPNIAIVMVDGGSYDPVLTWMQSVVTRQYGIYLIAIGIGTKITSKSFLLELEGIASGPYRQNVYTVASFDDLDTIEMVSNVTKLLCNDKNECSSNPCLNEGGCYDSIESFICDCPPGFTGQICQIASGRVLDLLFVVEVSNQVDPADYGAILELMRRVVRQMNIAPQASRVGVILFGSRAQVLIRLGTYTDRYDIMHALAMLQFTFIGGDPDAAGAIQLVKQHFQQVPATDSTEQRIAFFIVNAKSVEKKVADASLSLRLQGVEIFVLTYGSLDLETTVDLYSMVSRPGSSKLTTLFVAETREDFVTLAPNITYMIYNNLNWCATAPCENDGKCTNQLLDYTCQCPESATGKQCERACSRHMDLAFLVDTSRTMGQHFLMAIQFAKELIHGLDFRYEGVKLALVTLGSSPVLRFGLDEYTTKKAILEAFTIPGIGGKTDLVAGLSMLKEQVFVNDRNGVDDIAILITDGNIYQSRSQIQRVLESLNEGDADVEDTSVYVVAVGKNVDHDFVKKLHPEHRPVYLRGQSDLPAAVDATMANICG